MRMNKLISVAVAFGPMLASCVGDEEPPVSTKPDTPTVMVPETVCATPAVIEGTKQSSTSIWIDGKQIVPLDEKTSFMASVPLTEGVQTLSVTAKSATGEESDAATVMTTLDVTAPDAPTVEPIPNHSVVMEMEYTLRGTKPANTSVLINGTEEIAANADTTWEHVVSLMSNQNNPFRITVRDNCRESAVVEIGIFQDPSGIGFAVDDPATPTCDDTQEAKGQRAPNVAILLDGTVVVPAGPETTWSYVVQLSEGDNTFTFEGMLGDRMTLPREITIEYDATPPEPPTGLMAPEFTCEPMLMVMGMKEANTEILLNDSRIVDPDTMTTFTFTTTLQAGTNLLQVDTKDFCDRPSGRPVQLRVTLDTEPPSLMVEAPTAGETLTGIVEITGEAMDNQRAESVEIAVDGAVVETVQVVTSTMAGMMPRDIFIAQWDTTSVTDGTHLLSITAIDLAEKRSAPVSLMVEVANSARIASTEAAPPNNDARAARSALPAISVLTNGNVAVAWHDNLDVVESGNDDDILLIVYNNGTQAQPVEVVSSDMEDARSQQANVAGTANGGVHVVWQEDGDIDGDRDVDWDIVYRSFENGAFSPSTTVISGPPSTDGRSQYPDIATDAMGGAHVVWQDNGNLDGDNNSSDDADIYYSFGGPGGFNTPVLVSNSMNDGNSLRPSIAVTPDNCPHVTWFDDGNIGSGDNDNARDVYYRGSSSNGGGGCTWGPVVQISTENGFTDALRPQIAADPMDPRGLLYITWEGLGDVANNMASMNDRDIFMRNVFNNVPGTLVLVSDDPNDDISQQASIVVDETLSNVHMAWVDNGNIAGTGTDNDVFIRSWNGAMLTPIGSVSDVGMNMFNTEASLSPRMAARGAQVLVVWQDKSDYDGDTIADDDTMYLIR